MANLIKVINKNIIIFKIPTLIIGLMKKMGAESTIIKSNYKISSHSHKFLAVYFTENVKYIETNKGFIKLPYTSIAIVFPNAIHGWVNTISDNAAFVSHFHKGHPAHIISQA